MIIDDVLCALTQEKHNAGRVIDERSLNGIPFGTYVELYKEYEDLIELLEAHKNKKTFIRKVVKGDVVWAFNNEGQIYKCWVETSSSTYRILSFSRYYYSDDDTCSSYYEAEISNKDFGVTVFLTLEEAVTEFERRKSHGR